MTFYHAVPKVSSFSSPDLLLKTLLVIRASRGH